jgi:hypothetical protein
MTRERRVLPDNMDEALGYFTAGSALWNDEGRISPGGRSNQESSVTRCTCLRKA